MQRYLEARAPRCGPSPSRVRQFLVHTAVLRRLDARCATPSPAPRTATQGSMSWNDGRCSWRGPPTAPRSLRYHPLFGELLRRVLHEEDPAARRASCVGPPPGTSPTTRSRPVSSTSSTPVPPRTCSTRRRGTARSSCRETGRRPSRAGSIASRRRRPHVDREHDLLEAAAVIFGGDGRRVDGLLDAIDAAPDAPPGCRAVARLLRGYAALQVGADADAAGHAERVLRLTDATEVEVPDVLGVTTTPTDVRAAAMLTGPARRCCCAAGGVRARAAPGAVRGRASPVADRVDRLRARCSRPGADGSGSPSSSLGRRSVRRTSSTSPGRPARPPPSPSHTSPVNAARPTRRRCSKRRRRS